MFINFGKECQSCNTYKEQLNIVREENKNLLDTILNFLKPKEVIFQETKTIEPIKPKAVPWDVRKRQLEENDRINARLKNNHPEVAKDIEKLEEELGVKEI